MAGETYFTSRDQSVIIGGRDLAVSGYAREKRWKWGLWTFKKLPPEVEAAPEHDVNVIEEGVVIPIGYGYFVMAGNIVRVNNPNDNTLKMVVGHCQGEIETLFSWFVNDVEYGDLSSASHYKAYATGTYTQTVPQQGGVDIFNDKDSAYRGLAYTIMNLDKNDKAIRGTPKVKTVGRLKKCEPIGGGATAFSRSPATILWNFYRNVEGYAAASLDSNAFNSLAALCDAYPTSGDGSPWRPPGPNSTTVMATSYYNTNFKPHFACAAEKSFSGPWDRVAWLSGAYQTTNQRLNVDLGVPGLLTKITLVNAHYDGTRTDAGINAFAIQGSNSATAFVNTDYADDTNWTNLQTGLTATVYSSAAPQQDYAVSAPGATAYRYFSLKIASNQGSPDFMGIRDIIFWVRQPRYTFDYLFDKNITMADAKKLICKSFNGAAIMSQGKIKPVFEWSTEANGVGGLAAKIVRYAFTLSNIVKDSFTWWKPDRYNIITVKFFDQSDNWKKSSVTLRDDADIEERGEVTFEEEAYYLTGVDSARRRAQFLLDSNRYDDYHCELEAFMGSVKLELMDLVTVTHTLPGWATKQFLVVSKAEDEYGVCKFELQAYHGGLYDDRQAPVQATYKSTLPNPYQIPDFCTGVSATDRSYWDSSGNYTTKSEIAYTRPANDTFFDRAKVYYGMAVASWDKGSIWGTGAAWGADGDGALSEYPSADFTDGGGFLLGGNVLGIPIDGAAYVKVASVTSKGVETPLVLSPGVNAGFSSPSLQDAINNMPNEGGQIFLPPGEYRLAAAITMPNKPIEIVGVARDKVIIKNHSGSNLFVYNNITKKMKLSNFSIASQNSGSTSYMIYAYGANSNIDLTIDNIAYSSNVQDSFLVSNYGNSLTVEKCKINGTAYSIIRVDTTSDVFISGCFINSILGAEAIVIDDATNAYIYNNSITTPSNNSAIFVTISGISNGDVIIDGNVINAPQLGDFNNGLITISSINRPKITNNTINISDVSNLFCIGIGVDGCNEFLIDNNKITIDVTSNQQTWGIWLNNGSSRGNITNNNIKYDNSDNTSYHGAIGMNGGGGSYNLIQNNHFDGVNTDVNDLSVYAGTGANYNAIKVNRFYRDGTNGLDFGTGNVFDLNMV